MSYAAKPEIVLLGGSGDVGSRLARMLLEHTTANIITVSRRGAGDANHPDSRLRHVSLDISSSNTLETAAGSVTVNLTEATPAVFAQRVIESGGWFLETSATSGYLNRITDVLSEVAGPGTAILCVGAAPGMTNLMAEEFMAANPKTGQIDIGVEMGMGRHYGVGGTEWFLRTAGQPYPVVIDDTLWRVMPGHLKRRFSFGEGQARPSIGYGFAEQTLIAKQSHCRLKTVRSFVALDPVWMTRGLALVLSMGLGPVISRHTPKLTKWLRRLPTVGSSRSRLVVEGFDEAGQLTGQIRLETGDQAEATAAMIFATICSVLQDRKPAKVGVTMITDYLSFDAAAANLRRFLPETVVTVRIGYDDANSRNPAA